MNKTLRASFSLNENTLRLLRLVSDFDSRSMSGQLRFLVRDRANEILALTDFDVDRRNEMIKLMMVIDETDAD